MAQDKKKNVLGRGLGALLSGTDEALEEQRASKITKDRNSGGAVVVNIPLEQIEVNPFQPRSTFEEDSLLELAESIKIHGVIQPITVRQTESGRYQLIAGERRLRASKLCGKTEIPAYVRTASDQESIEIALIENIQREDLNPIEIAINYKRLMDECGLTQEQLSQRVGKNRSSVTNYLRLLKLPPDIQAALRDETITMGHAKALLGVEQITTLLALFKEVVNKGLSVRQTEELVRNAEHKQVKKKVTPSKKELPLMLKKLQEELTGALNTKVSIKPQGGNKGEIVISYYSAEDLERLRDIFIHA
ncbi:MAG: ParB/RepB/Spo0J family partition protein [Chitinophagales bacterium]|nr:ParB/RepB/Spo0J family partition protein [Chitinophagales bacterium]MDW8273827.1 ParB/RepB/Spo0J family partition protein [Chitinophagales bacterium]